MIDIGSTVAAKSDQLNADDLMGGPRNLKITGVSMSGNPDQPVTIDYEGGKGRPFKPCKSMRRALIGIWGLDGQQYIGKTITVYRDPTVTFGAQEVGGIRISHASHIDEKKTMALTAKKGGVKKLYTILPLSEAPKVDPKAEAQKTAEKMISYISGAKNENALNEILNDPHFKSDFSKISDAYSEIASSVSSVIDEKKKSLPSAQKGDQP